MKKECKQCGDEFERPPCHIGKFCGMSCYGKSKKGFRGAKATEFKKGENTGEEHPLWKGDDVGYQGVHKWLIRKLERATSCKYCYSKENVHWANNSGEYKRALDDWTQLCQVCHWKFDGITKLEKEDAYNIKRMYKLGERQKNLAYWYGVDPSTISNIINDKIKYYVS